MPQAPIRTAVGIVGAGPAGLMLSHLLAQAGIDSVVVDHRTRAEIEGTSRAGMLEADNVRLLTDSGVSDRVRRDGRPHDGIELRFGGESHRVDFRALVGESVWLYPQTDVFTDLADARERDGGDVRFGVSDTRVSDLTGERPGILFTDADGAARELRCDILVGADGSRGVCRSAVPEAARTHFFREYPYAWFGVLVEAPPSSPELVYTHSERGFALISQRTESVQRMYFQCDPDEDPAAWPDDRIWAELQARVRGADGFTLKEGPVTDRSVLRFRSFVCEPMRYGNMLLAGDAAHTVPPTGAKGLNLALADVRLLAEALETALTKRDRTALDEYGPRALRRVWRAQHFSYWMTAMLHRAPGATDFDVRRQLAELAAVVDSPVGSTYLAQAYTGWSESRPVGRFTAPVGGRGVQDAWQ
ncbi:4-hydroxybenzoate 3-monooxygenase [Streptomyces sp. NPDC059991]|uniref:4-hydroxybenzoate 3-monooxygenase n=1 Tax=Streptomyces sp. NPDC059991 TaxID=3347028 RepID=UPI0036C7A581